MTSNAGLTQGGCQAEEEEDKEMFGDVCGCKSKGSVRMTFQNVRGLHAFVGGYKDCSWREMVNSFEVDIVAMAEINLDWRRVEKEHRFQRRIRDWWNSSAASVSHNLNESLNRRQWGGCIVTAVGEVSHRVMERSVDPSQLGRWSCLKLRGRGGRVCRFVSVYRPVRPSNGGPLTTYAQHQRFLLSKGDVRDPREALLLDLGKEIDQWHSQNESVVIGGDWNTEVTSSSFKAWVSEHNLINVMTTTHPNQRLPATVSPGTKAVDAILSSAALRIEACGILPDDYGADSDHALLWLDVAGEELFGPIEEVDIPKPRRLRPHDPRVRDQYLNTFTELATDLCLVDRAFALEQDITGLLSDCQVQELEQLLQDRLWCMEKAESRCRKLRMGAIPWSPCLKRSKQRVRFWSLTLAKLRGKRVKSKQLKRLRTSANIITENFVSEDDVKAELDTAWKDYKETRARAGILRSTHLSRLAQAIADDTNQEVDNVVSRLQHREEIRASYRRIRWMHDPTRNRGLTAVRVGGNDGDSPLEGREDIEEACLNENARRFRQATDTPFMCEPLRGEFGAIGMTKAADQVLDGEYVPPAGVDPHALRLIRELKRDIPPEGSVPDRISTDDFVTMWNKAKEKTSSSPFSPHFGHWQCMAKRRPLADFQASIANICYTTGYSPSIWRKGVNVFLEKKAGVIDIDKLRIILLYDAEFNFTNKLTGRRLMANAERFSAIAPEQYGSRKGRSAIDHALNKRLTFDYWRLTKETGVLCSNDAKSCYDRIVHSVAALSMRRLGIGKAPVTVMLQTVQQLRHFVRTHYGDSVTSKEPESLDDFVHGIGQGNGSGPAIWVAISTPLLNILRRDGFGATIRGAISDESLRMVGFAIVDDTDLIQEANVHQSRESAIARMQQSLNMWEGSLKATGGALVPEKSFWYLVSFKFERGKWRYVKDRDDDNDITMRNALGQRVVLQRCDPDEARRTLGVRLAPDGNNAAQFHHMKSVALEWSQKLNSSYVRRSDAWVALTTTILKTLEYPLLATTLSERECDEIIRPVLRAALPASGVIFTFPRVVLYGTPKAGGLGLRNLATTQGIQQVAACLTHGYTLTTTGRLIRANIEAHKVEAGFSGDLFSMPRAVVSKYASVTWLTELWRFMEDNGLHIHERTQSLRLKCAKDGFIMEELATIGTLDGIWSNVNHCRLYLRATTLSDIGSGDGRFIPQWALQGTRRCHALIKFPVQPKPSPSAWRDWRKALSGLCTGPTFHLRQPLGPWMRDSTHHWYVMDVSDQAYERMATGFKVYVKGQGRSNRRVRYKAIQETVPELPAHAYPAEVRLVGAEIQVLGHRPWEALPMSIVGGSVSVTSDDQWATGHVLAVSDGSFKDGHGAAAWVFADQRGSVFLSGSSRVPGRDEDQSAYRSELYGIYRILCCIADLEKSSPDNERQITVGCDGESALYMSLSTLSTPSPMRPHFDLLSAIYTLRHQIRCKLTPIHVRGHQDDLGGPLSVLETLNVQVDRQAKHALLQTRNEAEPLQLGAWTLTHGNREMTGLIDGFIREVVHDGALRNYWATKHQFLEADVDWEALGKTVKAANINQRIWWSKHASGFEASGKVMHRRKIWQSPICRRCNRTIESSSHIGRCSNSQARQDQDEARVAFEKDLNQMGTSRAMRNVFASRIESWQTNPAFPMRFDIPSHLQQATRQQDKIGWGSFTMGFVSIEWRMGFAAEQARRAFPRSPGCWARNLVRRVWKIPWSVWEKRNKVVHEQMQHQQNMVEMIDINTRLVTLYNQGCDSLHSSLHRFFLEPLQLLLQRPPEYRQAWVLTVESGADMGDTEQ